MIINKKLEKEFDLMPLNIDENNENNSLEKITPQSMEIYEKLDKINSALPIVNDLESDKELDELAAYGIQAHKDLMDLAVNVEQRFCGEIASAAGNMLGHAIDARVNKLKKKLKMVELQIKKQIADQREKSNDNTTDPKDLNSEGHLMDRNELLAHLLKKS